MVDPVGVLLLEGLVDDLVEVLGGGKIGAEWLLHDYPRPRAGLRLVEVCLFQVQEDVIEELWGGGEVEQAVALAAALPLERVEVIREGVVSLEVLELAAVVGDGAGEILPQCLVVTLAGVLAVGRLELAAELIVGFVAPGESDDAGVSRQVAILQEVVESRDQLAVGEVSRGTKDDNGAGLRRLACGR